MVLRFAVGVRSANQTPARADTGPFDASEGVSAIAVQSAFRLHATSIQNAPALVRIPGHSLGTHALVPSLLVQAVRTVSARSVQAFVDVDASLERIALEAGLAHALGRVARRALGVDSAREPLAGVPAGAVLRVGEEGQGAGAFAGLHAFFVGRAVVVADAPFLGLGTLAVVGVALVAWRTAALESSWFVRAFRPVAAHVTFRALVDVFAGTAGQGPVALGTSAVADTAGDRNALGSYRARFALGASGQNAVSVDQLVRGLTSALRTVAL